MVKEHRFSAEKFLVEQREKLDLSKRSTSAGKELKNKAHASEELAIDVTALQSAQRLLYASDTHSLLVIFQGMDAAGKDGTIGHVMGGINPQGCRVYSFKAPNSTDLQYHFLNRAMPCLPARGMISLFNRSYYEEVLVVRVHPQFLLPQKLPMLKSLEPKSLEKLWQLRYQEINAFEETLAHHGTVILKFYLHVSREEQKKRLLERLNQPEKYWKFNSGDLAERKLWPEYQQALEQALQSTSTKWAPWYVIPADDKWYTRAAVADLIAAKLEALDLEYPVVAESEKANFEEYRQQLIDD